MPTIPTRSVRGDQGEEHPLAKLSGDPGRLIRTLCAEIQQLEQRVQTGDESARPQLDSLREQLARYERDPGLIPNPGFGRPTKEISLQARRARRRSLAWLLLVKGEEGVRPELEAVERELVGPDRSDLADEEARYLGQPRGVLRPVVDGLGDAFDDFEIEGPQELVFCPICKHSHYERVAST